MIKSMTGFSKVEKSNNNLNFSIELKSLNGKNLELNFRMPKYLNEKEIELREIFRKKIFRGTVSIYINNKYRIIFHWLCHCIILFYLVEIIVI